ncbi:hypothetical protein [Pseudonocardia acaciae]|uniref:hypothetical protein n=1 Tax=Pseudonocardia acaciae TaxID=551276 RepID=UPI000491C720|nr:hypothetical protein [Pseudonocardia acaciae]
MRRRRLFDDVLGVVEHARIEAGAGYYPVLTGWFRGYPVRLEAVVDTLALRRLPELWLLVTQGRRLDVGAPLDVLARPTGTEFFSPNGGYPHELPRPEAIRTHVRIATPDPSRAPVSVLDGLGPLLDDPRTKEVLVSAGGIRLVHRLAEGAQGPYRSLRRADFGDVRVGADRLRSLLDAVAGIGDTLALEHAGHARRP